MNLVAATVCLLIGVMDVSFYLERRKWPYLAFAIAMFALTVLNVTVAR